MLAILAESALRSLVLGSIVWVGLNLLRVRNPHVHMTSWAMVLAASLLMPLLMHWTTVTIILDPLPLPTSEKLWPAEIPLSEPLIPSLPLEPGVPGVARGENEEAVNWWGLATAIYALVSAVLSLRLAIGIYLTWRLVRAAKPMSEPWAAHSDVRVSDAISGPVTFGSTILLLPNASNGICPSVRPCLPTRAPTSPTATSMSCSWPRSIARCIGSARLRGGSSSGWQNLPKS